MFRNRYAHRSFGRNQRGDFCNTNKPNAGLCGNVNLVARIEVLTLLRTDLFLDDQHLIDWDLFQSLYQTAGPSHLY